MSQAKIGTRTQYNPDYYYNGMYNFDSRFEIFLEDYLETSLAELYEGSPESHVEKGAQIFSFSIMFDYGLRSQRREIDCKLFQDEKCVAELLLPQNQLYVSSTRYYSGYDLYVLYDYLRSQIESPGSTYDYYQLYEYVKFITGQEF